MEIVPWFIQRASEPSTWAGFAGLAVVFGLSQAEWAAKSNAIAAAAAALAMFVGERSLTDGLAQRRRCAGLPLWLSKRSLS